MSTDLTGREFDIVEVHGVPVLESSSPDILFGSDGRVSGRATVNRLMGQYTLEDTLEGSTVRFGALATTMMAGPPEHMQQEQRVLDALTGPLEVRNGDDGAVLLVSEAGTVVLRPKVSIDDASLV